MSEGIRATVDFPSPARCTIAELSREAGSTVDSVWTSVAPPGEVVGVSEFIVEAAEGPPAADGVEHVMSIGNRHVLRFAHGDDGGCPCQHLGEAGVPVQRYAADDGDLRLVFNAVDFDELRDVVGDLRDRFPDLDVRRLVRSPGEGDVVDAAYVDRGRLTSRQLTVLRTAYEMGYFQRPRGANATEVADALSVDPSTVTEHLSIAVGKLLEDVLD